MMIRSVKISNFKVHESFQHNSLGKDVSIYGENFQGKSSIAKAILFALEGVTETGSNRTDDLVRNGAKKTTVGVEVSFDGTNWVEIIREKGKTGAAKIFIDRQKASQTDIDALLGTKEHFMSVFLPGYFTRMTNDKARELIMTIIKPPVRDAVLEAIGISAKYISDLSLLDPTEDLKETRDTLKRNRELYQRILGQIEVYNTTLSTSIPEERIFDASELDKLLQWKSESNALVLSKIDHLKNELSGIRPRYDRRKRDIKEIPDAPYKENEPCPVCTQSLTSDALTHVLQHHENDVKKIKEMNKNITLELKEMIAHGNELSKEIKSLSEQVNPEEIAKLEEKIRVLQQAQQQTKEHNARVKALQESKQTAEIKVEELKKQLDSLDSDESEMNEVIKALGEYRSKYAEMQLSQLKVHLKHANIELFSVVKSTGELKPAFDVTFKNIPFAELSHSEKIRCNLEFATMINRITERDYPVFIDDLEGITHYDRPFATQVFTAKVVKDSPLTVE